MAKLGAEEAQRINQLTVAALVFLPLSFIASLFSMSGQFALDAERQWIYWTVALPLTGLVTLAGVYRPRIKKKTEVMENSNKISRRLRLWGSGASY